MGSLGGRRVIWGDAILAVDGGGCRTRGGNQVSRLGFALHELAGRWESNRTGDAAKRPIPISGFAMGGR